MSKKTLIIGLAVLFVVCIGVSIFGFTRVSNLNKQIADLKQSLEAKKASDLLTFDEYKALESDAYQAVFLSNGQVYFGQITKVNPDYIVLSDIFYLNASEPVQPSSGFSNDISLVKLGCELHGPSDVMHIPKSSVTFWENLKKHDSQVVKAIEDWKGKNLVGHNCANG